MDNKWSQTWFRDTRRGCLLYLLIFLFVFPLGCCLILLPLQIVMSQPSMRDSTAISLLFIPISIFFLLLFGGVGVASILILRKRALQLDAVFTPLGLTGSAYAITGRQYHGYYRSRQVDVYIYRGPGLLFKVSANTSAHLVAAAQTDVTPALARLFNNQPLLDEMNMPGIIIFVQDVKWGQAFMEDTFVHSALQELIHHENSFLFRQVHIQSGAISLKLWRSNHRFKADLNARQAVEWADQLIQLAETAEHISPK